jgi:hypothetical protein
MPAPPDDKCVAHTQIQACGHQIIKLKEVWFKPEDIKFFIETNNGLLERIRFDHGEVGAQ